MDNQLIKNKENTNDMSGLKPEVNDMDMLGNNDNNISFSKPFKSRYINETGKWSRKAVDEGMVDFDDYIKDIETEPEDVPNFNNKVLTISNTKTDMNYNSQGNKKKSDMLYDYSLSDTNPTLTASFPGYVDSIKDKAEVAKYWFDKGKWSLVNLGKDVTEKAFNHTNSSGNDAQEKAAEWDLNTTWNNKADAYRHFIWNAKMTRDTGIGYYNARNITNRYEYENMQEYDMHI